MDSMRIKMHKICRNMQKKYKIWRQMYIYAEKIYIYMKNMDSICKNVQINMQKYALKYAEICRSPYFAYFAYVCTPHFADGTPRHKPRCF